MLIFDLYFLDTDSICLCATGELDEIVRPSKRDGWPAAKKAWFVLDPNDAHDARYPGKMKEEWASNTGKIVAYVYKVIIQSMLPLTLVISITHV